MQRYLEDFKIGMVDSSGPYTVTKEEIVRFAREFDPQPFHIDEKMAAASVFGGLTASGAHTVALQMRLIHESDLGMNDAVLAGMGWDEVRFLEPVRPGDTLFLTIECIDKRISDSNPGRGVVKNLIILKNQKEETVLKSIHTILVAARRRDKS